MKAAVMEKPDSGLVIYDDVDIIEPRHGEVRVKVHYCGVCHSDLSVMSGAFGLEEPVILGHEASGVVEKVGAGVRDLQPGDHVVLTPAPSCGQCYYCLHGDYSLCVECENLMTMTLKDGETGLSRKGKRVLRGVGVGAFAEYVVAPSYGVVKIDKSIPLETICVLGCGVQTGVGSVLNIAKVKPGSSVFVAGLGGIGQAVVQGARIAGAGIIIASDPVAERRKHARQFGATHVMDPGKDDAATYCKEVTGNIGVDYAFESSGVAGLPLITLNTLRRGGHLVCVGVPAALDATMDLGLHSMFVVNQVTVSGCLLGGCKSAHEVGRMTDLWQHKRLDLENMITARRPLKDINLAFEDMKAGKGIRTVIEIN
jgi:Zn-dependent alcohol dehydrogenase